MNPKNIFLAHASSDHEFACRLSGFLEFGCNVTCSAKEGLIGQGDLLTKAEEGLASDILLLLLSKAAWPVRWPRERWERILFEETRSAGVELVSVLLNDCPFPPLLRRRNFIDGTHDETASRLATMRLVKRWIWHRETEMAQTLNPTFAEDLEDLYYNLSDQAGTLKASGTDASRFVREAGQEFEAVLWIPCHRRTLAQIVGELGSQLGLPLDGTLEQNRRNIHDLLARRRCLLVLDSPAAEFASELIAGGRTSTLVTQEPVKVVETPRSLAQARKLISSRRFAEAYELLYGLIDSDISTADCARELTWICEHWNQMDEAESLRFHYRLPPTEQLSLF
jgi:hypothetical protein